jgi:hypothetical protein
MKTLNFKFYLNNLILKETKFKTKNFMLLLLFYYFIDCQPLAKAYQSDL